MRPRRLCPVLALAFALCLLPACASHQDNGSAGFSDPETSARQEFVADMMLSVGRVLLAAEGYDRALLARPADASLRVKKGRALLRLNQAEAALAEFRLALGASPELAAAHYGAGQACARLGQSAEAREALERAVALAPDSWRSRCQLGVLLLNAGRAAQAREQFLAALALPQAFAGRDELLNNLGLAQVLAGDTEAAVRTFSQALREARDPERSANNLGLLLVRLGRHADALSAFRAGGNDARALNNLGYALYLQGEAPQARALFEKALDLSPAYYQTAGENLKLAVQSAAAAGSAGQGAGGAASQGAAGPGVTRISLSTQSGQVLRFGPATLLGASAPVRWTR